MKKILFLFFLLGGAAMIFGCSRVSSAFPKQDRKECNYGEGSQDYVDYCKYFYNSESVKSFEKYSNFSLVTSDAIPRIREYFEDYDVRVKEERFSENYDFDSKVQIKQGDYFYITTKDGYDNFSYYDVYYVDTQKLIMYYIHVNT